MRTLSKIQDVVFALIFLVSFPLSSYAVEGQSRLAQPNDLFIQYKQLEHNPKHFKAPSQSERFFFQPSDDFSVSNSKKKEMKIKY